ETDEPMVTNPMMYNIVKNHPTVKELYARFLIEKGILTEEESKNIEEEIRERLQNAYDSVAKKDENPDTEMNPPEYVMNEWTEIKTTVEYETLKTINQELLEWPEDFNVFSRLARILQRREAAFQGDGKIDWAHAEALAFGSILRDGTPI